MVIKTNTAGSFESHMKLFETSKFPETKSDLLTFPLFVVIFDNCIFIFQPYSGYRQVSRPCDMVVPDITEARFIYS